MNDQICDVGVIGAGILGLAAGLTLLERHPDLRVVVLEKEHDIARQQTGHNSGVIHSGIYYAPGSLKAGFCVRGREALLRFCGEHGVRTRRIGKLIVATRTTQLARLSALEERGRANGVRDLCWLSGEELADLEPATRGVAALFAPGTAIVDFREVAAAMLTEFRALGGRLVLGAAVESVRRPRGGGLVLETARATVRTSRVLNCAGLHADRIACLLGERPALRILPFRGEYFTLRADAARRIRHLVYPVPDPSLPFLGVHLTPTMAGIVKAGPNAVLATQREGYRRSDFSARDTWETLSFPGFWGLARRHWRTALAELHRSLSKEAFAREARELMPSLESDDLDQRLAGVRAQAVDLQGRLLDDFRVVRSVDAVHVLNAPSPAATSALAIARHLVDSFADWLPAPSRHTSSNGRRSPKLAMRTRGSAVLPGHSTGPYPEANGAQAPVAAEPGEPGREAS